MPSNTSTVKDRSAWADRAEELALWAFLLVNRLDAWGGYYRTQDASGAWTTQQRTCPRVADRGRLLLTRAILERHFRATCTRDVCGLHTTSPDNTSLWGAVDVDWHGPESTAPAINLRAALAWYDKLAAQGWHPLLTSSNGQGGYHLRLLLAQAIETARLHAFLQLFIRDYRRHGMTAQPETFPKQAQLRSPYGNWLRLPGRHHTRDYWSEVWDGRCWLAGAAAVEHILQLQGDPIELVPALPPSPPPRRPRPFVAQGGNGNLAARIAGYVRRCCPNLSRGQGRDDVAWRLAAFLLRDLAVSADIAQEWLRRWDAGNNPPLGAGALVEIAGNAKRYGQHAEGCGREPVSAGGVQVIHTRRPGHVIIHSRREVRR
jgi:hypothetical protein